MTSRWWRRVAAAAVTALGAVDLIQAASLARPLRWGFFGVDVGLGVIVGARYVLVVCGLAALLVARGVLHGKRNAWVVALLAAVASLPGHHLNEADAVGLATGALSLAVLLAGRSHFSARSDPALARRGLETLGIGAAATFLYGVIGLYTLDNQFRSPTTLAQAARASFRLLFLLPVSNIEPATRHGRWLIESVRFAALAVAVVGAARLVATAVRRPGHRPQDQAKVEELLAGWATTSLAPFQLLDDKSWFFAGDEAFVGYKVLGTTAVALGEPIGRPDSQRLAVAAFVEFCEGNGWTPAFHQVTAHGVELGRAAGLRSLKVGEEAIIDLDTWDLDAKHNKGLRSALRRVERAGAHLVELQRPLDEPTLNELSEVSDAWLADSGHRERTFSLGRFDRDTLRRTPVLAVREAGDDTAPGRILAFANVLPSYQSLEGNFDLMRRRPDAPNGVMETLFVGLIDRFRGEGKKGMNLGLAPLSGIEGNSLAERALRRLYERGGLAFNYGGLRRYKEKWQPRWEPRYLLYHAETDLARVAAAVARAGELPDPRSLTSRLLGVVRRFPVTVALLTLLAWLMAATAIDPSLHHELLRQFGLAWHDLQRLQLWRLPTSQLIQAHSGWGWNLLIALVVLTLAERRLGSARTLTVFFVADWGSTGAILLALRIAAALGNTMAADTIGRRDGGVSSALYALGTVLAASLSPGRTRRVALAAAAAVIVGPLLANHNLAAAQHLGAALVALGIWWRWQPHSKRGPDIATADRSSSIDTQAARP